MTMGRRKGGLSQKSIDGLARQVMERPWGERLPPPALRAQQPKLREDDTDMTHPRGAATADYQGVKQGSRVVVAGETADNNSDTEG